MTPRPQPRKPDALDLAETLELASRDLARFSVIVDAYGHAVNLFDAREAAQRVLAAIDEYEGRS